MMPLPLPLIHHSWCVFPLDVARWAEKLLRAFHVGTLSTFLAASFFLQFIQLHCRVLTMYAGECERVEIANDG